MANSDKEELDCPDLSPRKKKVGKFILGKTIGSGSFGRVKTGVHCETGKEVAVKIIEKDLIVTNGLTEQIRKEISILKRLNHINVVNMLDVLASKSKIYLVMDLLNGGEISSLIAKEGRLSEARAHNYWRQLIAGVEYCHQMGVCHRDLKPENLLLTESGVLKITDFGLSAILENGQTSKLLFTQCGTPNYVAPEVMTERGYDGKAADIWSCGVILYVFLTGCCPFEDPSTEALFKKIRKADVKYVAVIPKDAKQIMEGIFVVDPKKRITISEIKEKKWFKQEHIVNLSPESNDSKLLEDTRFSAVYSDSENNSIGDDVPDSYQVSNAFEIIALTMAIDLSLAIASPDEPLLSPSEQRNNEVRFKARFVIGCTLEELNARIQRCCSGFGFHFHQFSTNKSKIIKRASKTSLTVRIHSLYGGSFFVEFRRDQGPSNEFLFMYNQIQSELADLTQEDANLRVESIVSL